ncbi:D-alanine--D-alanine ligase family protein [Tellurirhabdus bombi]|uniref:D-alanine--D-alanine ligase family protein n=1 Tax=Tellurirhabdus bombi TaxID=2907205 RepID=UPI001F2396FF|nr:D-alanine--D-alanine ligase [Tellurirhabdus bombi]
MKVGIFFGGPAREREVAFAGGRTALSHIDKSLFEPIMVFVDGLGNFIRIREELLYQTDIRAFYPTQDDTRFQVYIDSLADRTPEEVARQIAAIGEQIRPEDFRQYFDIVFLAMHGPDCEDGAIQGLLEWYKIPYTGPGIMGSAVGINKTLQNELIALVNGQEKKTATITREGWDKTDKQEFFTALQDKLGLPIVVKAPHQGSSIGVSIVRESDLAKFCQAVEQCFFAVTIQPDGWSEAGRWAVMSGAEKIQFVQQMANLDEGIGFPVVIGQTGETIFHPADLLVKLDAVAASGESLVIHSVNAEDEVLFEEFIRGQEFSCGVIQDEEGVPTPLPPTEIYNVTSFDFKSKYQSSTTKKRIPVETTLENNRKIQQNVTEVFAKLGMNVCTRIDGFLTPDGRVLLHDPNTIPGMSPSSLIFKQMAEIGLNVTQTITYLIRQSLKERARTGKDTLHLRHMLANLDERMAERKAKNIPEEEIILTVGGEAESRWLEVKAQYARLAATGTVKPVVVLQTDHSRHVLSVNMLFKDTLAEVLEVVNKPVHPLIIETRKRALSVTERYS